MTHLQSNQDHANSPDSGNTSQLQPPALWWHTLLQWHQSVHKASWKPAGPQELSQICQNFHFRHLPRLPYLSCIYIYILYALYFIPSLPTLLSLPSSRLAKDKALESHPKLGDGRKTTCLQLCRLDRCNLFLDLLEETWEEMPLPKPSSQVFVAYINSKTALLLLGNWCTLAFPYLRFPWQFRLQDDLTIWDSCLYIQPHQNRTHREAQLCTPTRQPLNLQAITIRKGQFF